MEKLLIVVPSLGMGGQERVAINIAEILKKDFSIIICTFSLNRQFYFPECKILNMEIPSSNNLLGKIFNVFFRMYKLHTYIKKYDIKYVVSISSSAGILNWGIRNVFCIMQEHGYEVINKGIVSRLAYARADVITACSRNLCEAIKRYVPRMSNKCFSLYNPNIIDEIYNKSNEVISWNNDKKYRYMVSCGRLEAVKNYSRLIKAFKIFSDKHNNWRLMLIGDGTERANLEDLAKRLGIMDKVDFMGQKSNPFPYLAKCDLYVLSSFHEGLSNSLIEGMCFCPAVAVDCLVGPKEIMFDDINAVVDKPLVADYGVIVPDAIYGYEKSMMVTLNEDDISLYEGMCIVAENEDLYRCLRLKGKKRTHYFNEKRYRENILMLLKKGC